MKLITKKHFSLAIKYWSHSISEDYHWLELWFDNNANWWRNNWR